MSRRHSSPVERLRRTADIEGVFADGRRWHCPWAVAVVRRRPSGGARLAVIAGRRLGTAVVRNRAKRRLRAACRGFWARVEQPVDIVLVAREGANEAPSAALSRALADLLTRAGVLGPGPGQGETEACPSGGGCARRADTG